MLKENNSILFPLSIAQRLTNIMSQGRKESELRFFCRLIANYT